MTHRPMIVSMIVCVVLTAGLALAPSAIAAVTCSYDEAGIPGDVGNVLTIATSDRERAGVIRSGSAIRVRDSRGATVACTGGSPTVGNIDTVSFKATRPGAVFSIDLAGGQFAPGASPETSDPEIEFELNWKRGRLELAGTSGADNFAFGELPVGGGPNVGPSPKPKRKKSEPAANLNRLTEVTRDADLFLGDVSTIAVKLRGADDTLTAKGGTEFSSGLKAAALLVAGGIGNDLIVGGAKGDRLKGNRGADRIRGALGNDRLIGAGGRDRLFGAAGADLLKGGGGPDRAIGGAGDDLLKLRDRKRDVGKCGRGRDTAIANRKDKLRGCERVRRRR